jgi:ethanolamine utilization protein EutM
VTGGALGMIEARGLVCVTAAIEAMCKAADVRCVFVERVSSGYLAVAVQGDLASVQVAVDAGADSARRYGQVRSTRVYPAAHEAAMRLLERSPGWLTRSSPG